MPLSWEGYDGHARPRPNKISPNDLVGPCCCPHRRLHPEHLPRNKLRSESAAIRKAMEELRKKSSHHRIRILAFIQMFVATLILTAIWAVQTNGGMT